MEGSQAELEKQREREKDGGEEADFEVGEKGSEFVESVERGLRFEGEIGVKRNESCREQQEFGGLKEQKEAGLTGCGMTKTEFDGEGDDQQRKREKKGHQMSRQQQERKRKLNKKEKADFLDVVEIGRAKKDQKKEQERKETKQKSLVRCAGDPKARPRTKRIG